MATVKALFSQFDFAKITNPRQLYYRPQSPHPQAYIPLDDNTLLTLTRDTYLALFKKGTNKAIKETRDTIELMIQNQYPTVPTTFIQVSPTLFWDTSQGVLIPANQLPPDVPCFRKLFSTKYPSKHIRQIPPFSPQQEATLQSHYTQTLDRLNAGTRLPKNYDFIDTWADGSYDVYWDIMRAMAYCFLKKKPVGAYVLIGERRNGKSTFVGLLHTIFGTNNTSMVRLSQLGDPHYVNRISNTLLNAPDEEDDQPTSAQATFKTMADHGLLTLSVMRSNQPIEVHCDFMSFFPMNHIPEWKGTGAAACFARTIVIPFYADLSKFDQANENFAENTYTPDNLAPLLGEVLALASYYTTHPHKFSDTQKKERLRISTAANSAYTYRVKFNRLFGGVQSIQLLFQDYCNWCNENDYQIVPRKEFKFLFRNFERTSIYDKNRGGRSVAFYAPPQSQANGLRPLLTSSYFKNIGSLTQLHEMGASIITQLEEQVEEAKATNKPTQPTLISDNDNQSNNQEEETIDDPLATNQTKW